MVSLCKRGWFLRGQCGECGMFRKNIYGSYVCRVAYTFSLLSDLVCLLTRMMFLPMCRAIALAMRKRTRLRLARLRPWCCAFLRHGFSSRRLRTYNRTASAVFTWGDEGFRCPLRECLFPLYISRPNSVDFLIFRYRYKILLRILSLKIEIRECPIFLLDFSSIFCSIDKLKKKIVWRASLEGNCSISVYGSLFFSPVKSRSALSQSKKKPDCPVSWRIGQKVDEFMPSVYVKGRQRGHPFNVGRAGKG